MKYGVPSLQEIWNGIVNEVKSALKGASKDISKNKITDSLYQGILQAGDLFGLGTAQRNYIKRQLEESNWDEAINMLTRRINSVDITNHEFPKMMDFINNISTALYSVSGNAANKLSDMRKSLMNNYQDLQKRENVKYAANTAQKEYLLNKTDKMREIMSSGATNAAEQLTDLSTQVEQGLNQFIK